MPAEYHPSQALLRRLLFRGGVPCPDELPLFKAASIVWLRPESNFWLTSQSACT